MLDAINIVWFKRDLRTNDHAPLLNASQQNTAYITDLCCRARFIGKLRAVHVSIGTSYHDCLVDLNDELR